LTANGAHTLAPITFTGNNFLMNMLGAIYMRLKSWLSYLY
jgi:hypothetical protein